MNTLSKERKAQIERYCAITDAIGHNFAPLKLVDLNYDEKKGWVKTFEKVDPSIFDDSETELREILDAVDTKKIKYCEHNVTGKRYRINQRMKIMRHNFDVEIEQELN
tara:strand:- start:4078 stop:4401 length:324 start_codon:yes stop_codon:yes gene_type:complete